MINKQYLSYDDIKLMAYSIIEKLKTEDYIPDIIIAPLRGGLFLTQEILYFNEELGKDIDILTPKLKAYKGTENVGVVMSDLEKSLFDNQLKLYLDIRKDKIPKILLVDDINDSGSTFNYLIDQIDMKYSEVKIASLIFSPDSEIQSDFHGQFKEKNDWIVFPWDK